MLFGFTFAFSTQQNLTIWNYTNKCQISFYNRDPFYHFQCTRCRSILHIHMFHILIWLLLFCFHISFYFFCCSTFCSSFLFEVTTVWYFYCYLLHFCFSIFAILLQHTRFVKIGIIKITFIHIHGNAHKFISQKDK